MPSDLAERETRLPSEGRVQHEVDPDTRQFVSYSPIDGQPVGDFDVTEREAIFDARRRLSALKENPSPIDVNERIAAVRRMRHELAECAPDLTRTIARETGKTRVEIQAAEILGTLNALRWLERQAPLLLRPTVLRRFPTRLRLEYRPHGVIGLISAWNYPVFLTLPVIAAAVAAGNTVLWKPSELAAASSDALYELLERSGLSDRVVLAQGDAETGRAVVDSACDKYVFIGGGRVGREVLSRLGAMGLPAVAELSGSDPCLVLGDADLDLAARGIVWARTLAAGQTCMAPRRIYVVRSVYQLFLERVQWHLERLCVGDPLCEQTDVGPLRTGPLRTAALREIEAAIRGGATCLHGGEPMPGPGNYLRPTLLADCDESMGVFRDDLFAPVLAVCPVSDEEEAVRRAASAPYALTASVWTRSRQRGLAVARRLPGSVISVNDLFLAAGEGGVPFGGAGESGYGRVRGAAGLMEMVRTCVVDEGGIVDLPRFHYGPARRGTLSLLEAVGHAAGGDGSMGRWYELARAALAIRKG